MEVSVKKDVCIGCGSCVAICPSVFKMEKGKSVVMKKEGDKCAKEAMEACPVGAIIIKE